METAQAVLDARPIEIWPSLREALVPTWVRKLMMMSARDITDEFGDRSTTKSKVDLH